MDGWMDLLVGTVAPIKLHNSPIFMTKFDLATHQTKTLTKILTNQTCFVYLPDRSQNEGRYDNFFH